MSAKKVAAEVVAIAGIRELIEDVEHNPQAWVALGHSHLRRADMAIARAKGFPATRWSHPDDTYREQMIRTAAICLAAIVELDGAG